MPVRLGIELSPVACRIVELDATSRFRRDGPTTRVRSFARLPREGAETHRRLSSLGRRAAAVVVWGLQADHRQAVVEHGSFRTMRRAAVTAISNAGVETRGRVADIAPAPASRRGRDTATRAVIVALAPNRDLAIALRWLTGEGVRVQSIVTPALALMSLARLRDSAARGLPGTLDAYVALEERATAVALVRDGALVAACEIDWGYQDERQETRARGEIATRLADEIERFLAACGARPNAVSQICVCGGLPELRSMAVTLMQQLDVEVETLDSLFAIDARLPRPADKFRDQIAELRLAWAVAADWPAPINLLRERQRRLTKTLLTRAAVVAGVATGVGGAWQIQRNDWWRAPAANPRPTRTPATNPAAPAASGGPVRTPPAPRPTVPPAAPPVERQSARPPDQPPLVTPPARNQRPQASRSLTAAAQPETPLPFDAALGSILYAPDRKLAIVDGRIVQIGDDVRGAQVVDITPTSVLLRDEQGRVRGLTLGALGR